MSKLTIVCVAAGALLVGCKGKANENKGGSAAASGSAAPKGSGSAAASGSGSAVASGSATTPAPTGGAGIKGTAADKEIAFTQAFAMIENGTAIRIVVWAEPGANCDTSEGDRVYMKVPAGIDGKHYAGQTFAPDATVYLGKGGDLRQYHVETLSTVKLEDFKLEKGAHIKGHLEIDQKKSDKAFKLAGDFDAEICSVPVDPKAPPAIATTPAAGTVEGGGKFETKTAIVTMKHDFDNDLEYVQSVYLFSKAGVTCDTDRSKAAATGDVIDFHGFGGVTSKAQMKGTWLPAWPSVVLKGNDNNLQSSNAAVKFDDITSLEIGKGTVKGSVMLHDSLGYSITGTFSAIVCKGG